MRDTYGDFTPSGHAVIYARFSPRPDEETSQSADLQIQQCTAYCEQNDYLIRAAFSDKAISGTERNRPGLWSAIDALQKGDRLVVCNMDRVARSVGLAEYIWKESRLAGAIMVAVTGPQPENPLDISAKLIRQVFAAFAEYERDRIAERTSERQRQHQQNGRLMSRHAPYGFRIDPVTAADKDADTLILPEEHEQKILSEMVQLQQDGKGAKAIATTMESRGELFRNNPRWHPNTVRRILEREKRYAKERGPQ